MCRFKRAARRLLLSALLLVAASAPAAGASLCGRLSDEVRGLPEADWIRPPGPILQRLRLAEDLAGGRAAWLANGSIEQALLADSALRDALAVGPQAPVSIERLPGQSLVHLYAVQGTAHCQSSLFVELDRDGRWRRLPPPPVLGDDAYPCWTRAGSLGELMGRPVFVVHGRESQLGDDELYQVSAWDGGQWGQACSVRVAFRSVYRSAGAQCQGAKKLCERAASLAMGMAERYDRSRAAGRSFEPPMPATRPDTVMQAALEGVDPLAPPSFPKLDAGKEQADAFTADYSNADLQRFPVQLDGRWFIALLGHAGVGWRESDVTLLGLYTVAADGRLAPFAGFRVQRERAGLASIDVDDRH